LGGGFLDFIIENLEEQKEQKKTETADQADVRKTVMKLEKKLREIEALEKRRDQGEQLEANQLKKLEAKSAFEDELNSLHRNVSVGVVNVSISSLGGEQVLAPTAFDLSMQIDALANRAAGEMGHCGGCLLISEMGILPTHSTLEECSVVDGTNLIAMAHGDVEVINKYFYKMLLRSLRKLPDPPRFAIGTLVRQRLLELSPDRDRVVRLQINVRGQELPKELGLLTELRSLSLEKVKDLPCEVGNLSCLECLTIHGGTIDQLPIELGQLQSLKTLTLIRLENLQGLPDELDMLSELASLEAVDCPKLTKIPPGVAQFANINVDSNLEYNHHTREYHRRLQLDY